MQCPRNETVNRATQPGRRQFLRTAAVGAVSVFGVGRISGQETDGATEIENWHDLDAVRDGLDSSYLLVSDLDEESDGYDEYIGDTSDGWDPIGQADPHSDVETVFTGQFVGNGHEITGLVIDRPEAENVGLFSGNEGVIEGVTLTDCNVAGKWKVGGLVGLNTGTINDASVGGTVAGEEWIGGLVGHHEGQIENATASADVRGGKVVGGLAGIVPRGELRASTARGSVSGTFGVGGLLGEAWGTVRTTFADATVDGEEAVGGLIGQCFEENGVVKSRAIGVVSGDWGVGGLVGWNVGETVRDVAASGAVTGTDSVGGLVGSSEGTVTEAYASGEVTGIRDVGGVAGRNLDDGKITNAYWDTETTERSVGVGSGDGDVTGLETEQMRGETAKQEMTALDFDRTWTVVTDPTDYPALQWQAPDPPRTANASDGENRRTEDTDSGDQNGVGFGIGSAVTGLGIGSYLLKQSDAGDRTG
jgi:hypothetical protein